MMKKIELPHFLRILEEIDEEIDSEINGKAGGTHNIPPAVGGARIPVRKNVKNGGTANE